MNDKQLTVYTLNPAELKPEEQVFGYFDPTIKVEGLETGFKVEFVTREVYEKLAANKI